MTILLWLPIILTMCVTTSSMNGDCQSPDEYVVELMTGYVYTAPQLIMDTLEGVVQLVECIDYCRHNSSCHSLNYETGLCVLFGRNDDHPGMLMKSQFPVFTIFGQKICLRVPVKCKRPWLFEVVRDYTLSSTPRRRQRVASRRQCMTMCLEETAFTCRSASYSAETGDCGVSDMDRFTVANGQGITLEEGFDYYESNCVTEPSGVCDFTPLSGQLLKTVDSVHQNIENVQACRQLCLEENDYNCRTYDWDSGICRLSHHATVSLSHIEQPYLDLEESTSYQLASCYNVSVECRATDMIAHIRTNKLFNGKVYGKNRPNSCATDVDNSLVFTLRLGYHDLNCDMKQGSPGKFSTDIIIQHHDQIVTGQDIGLSVRCSYSLQNRSVGLGVQLEIDGAQTSPIEENQYIESPTVTMRITDRIGEDIHTAQVGDALSLRFQISDMDSPYQIFVRELIALDGVDSSEILLIDSLGCPTDPTIMGAISIVQSTDGTNILQAPFDAFKFPSSQVVQFKALVTPCMPICEPVNCEMEDYYGTLRRVDSYGRKKREIRSQPGGKEDVLVVKTIHIADKFQFSPVLMELEHNEEGMKCSTILLTSVLLVCGQVLIVLTWLLLCRKRRSTSYSNGIYQDQCSIVNKG